MRPPEYRDVMIDLETLGTRPGSVILSIGAVMFDARACHVGETFYSAIGVASSLSAGATIDDETLNWWSGQKPEACAAIFDALRPDAPGLRTALSTLTAFLAQQADLDKLRVWGNGANFDNVLLSAAYRQARQAAPWKFWNDRCFRTLKSTFPGHEPKRAGVHHNALDDARHQARWACNIMSARQAL